MYSYEYDIDTGGILLNSAPLMMSREPRPVYYKELDILGFDKFWNYAKDDTYPYMWAEANNYFYRGRKVAQTKGGSCYTAPKIIILEDPEPNGEPLKFIDIPAMVEKNRPLLESLVQETVKNLYNTYIKKKDEIDIFYVAFSGGKDSVVALDITQRTLPHDSFKVLFGDTGMEFSDTYNVVNEIKSYCLKEEIDFYRAKSLFEPQYTWKKFGPPAQTIRWCCSVHKTSPQILFLREILNNYKFTGMAITGVRKEESLRRSEYDNLSEDKKHSGQQSFHVILNWNSAELYTYIYMNNLLLNKCYKRGISRAGCMLCPGSMGKNDYMKQVNYPNKYNDFFNLIAETSGKTNYNEEEMRIFIESGFWRTRKSGATLNFGQDLFEVVNSLNERVVVVYKKDFDWSEWSKTIGYFNKVDNNIFQTNFLNKEYRIYVERKDDKTFFRFLDYDNSKSDIKFFSLFKSVIIKSIYCIGCQACVAECKFNCIDMTNGVKISDKCVHCHKCHEIHNHCLRYNSIRNKNREDKKMSSLDRYYSFGTDKRWLKIFLSHDGAESFWNTDGDREVPNKKKDAFRAFLLDAGVITYNKKLPGNKYTKCVKTDFFEIVKKICFDEEVLWALMLCNLAYTPEYNWIIKNLNFNVVYTPDSIKFMLEDAMPNDTKGLGKRNVVDCLKNTMKKTPLGESNIFASCDIDEKISSMGNITLKMNSFMRTPWQNPDPKVILYSLYKFAEACGNYYQFTLSRLLNHEIDSDGVSPTQIFGLEREQMEQLLNGLAINYPDFINVSFTHDLDNITLRKEKTSKDVLSLF